MPLSADRLLDRVKLKSEIVKWRSLAILAVILLALSFLTKSADLSSIPQDYIARVSIEGVITEDRSREQKLASLKSDSQVKAVIVYINSPGGTIVGGEDLYESIKSIAEEKPVVAVMGSLAASGGYMAALPAHKIFARSGTLTGSIGVMLQSAEVTELSRKIGVSFKTFKSAPLKGVPSPLEKLDLQGEKVINASIADSYEFFKGLVKANRPLSDEELEDVSDGRIFTGRQALQSKLIDELGGEDAAIRWLKSEKGIKQDISVKEVTFGENKMWFEKISSKVMGGGAPYMSEFLGNSVMALWSPAIL